MKLYSYVVSRDYGFAPNPFYGTCTLATCKPIIRRVAKIGDWVVGTGSKRYKRQKNVVYVMKVTGAMSFEDYWSSPEFQIKKPELRGSLKQAYGDNIYSKTTSGVWLQLNSHHSYTDGTPNQLNINNDTQTNRILYSNDFVYWGGSGPELPSRFMEYGKTKINICAVRGHKNIFPEELVNEFIDWTRSLHIHGFQGEPLNWRL